MANKPNPELQKAVLGHIKSHILKFGYPPTTRDLMAYTGRNSSSHMHSVLRKLEADGLITMEAGKSRTIKLVGYTIVLVEDGLHAQPIGMENYYLCSRRHVPGELCGECGRG